MEGWEKIRDYLGPCLFNNPFPILSSLTDLNPNTSLFSSLCLHPSVLPVTHLPSEHLTPWALGSLQSSPFPLPYSKHIAVRRLCQGLAFALASPCQLPLMAEQHERLGLVESEVPQVQPADSDP